VPLRILQIIAALLLAAVVGLALFWHPEQAPRALPRAPEPAGGDFTLASADGPVTLAAQRGKVVLIYFGYTYCPDICPTALAAVSDALERLSREELARVSVLFVSVDPARDTVGHLKEYAAFFHPAILGVTGTEAEIAEMATRYGVYYARQPEAAGGGYAVDHSSELHLIAPEGHPAGRLPHGAGPDQIVAEIRRLLKP